MGKPIMVMGTASGVGKSTVVLILCRLLTKMGYKVAPFKAQNITDQTFTIDDGNKIANSSRIAAIACQKSPQTDMGPILLEPDIANGVNIYASGKLIESSRDIPSCTFEELFKVAFDAYERLLSQNDFVIIEGAGSPVELNLLDQDIVNLNFALRAKAPILLVSDIIRGGIYAAVYGTLALVPEVAKPLFKGIVVNKFMGDVDLFEDGRALLAQVAKLPVIGVLPHTVVNIEEEDCFTDEGAKPPAATFVGRSDQEILESIDQLCVVMQKHLDMDEILSLMR